MVSFRDEMISRGWWLRSGAKTPATHLLLDGGRLAVSDDHSGTFLNVYFNALLRGEKLSVVELKTPIYRLFFDIDAKVSSETVDFEPIFRTLYAEVEQFWVVESTLRMIVCAAPSKHQDDATVKLGFHVIFPSIFVNAPIALAFRTALIEALEKECPNVCLNTWADAIDPSVFKANGLRTIYSSKGAHEDRAYVPRWSLDAGVLQEISPAITVQERRAYVHECSLRVFQESLTPCAGGQDAIADQPHVHSAGGVVIGRSVPLDAYADVLPAVHKALPDVYSQQRFVGIFKTDHAVMLRSSSRFCQNVQREHRTSTVYFCVTRYGVCQKCYCRKEEHGCDSYSSEYYPLETSVIDTFVPLKSQYTLLDDPVTQKMPSKKKSTTSLDLLLHRSHFMKVPPPKKTKKRKA